MHTTVCEGDFRQDSEHLQEGRSTTCVPTEDYTEGSTHKREGTTEAHGQGCGVRTYQIPCAQCDEDYIGETGRPLKTSEHKRAVATGDVRIADATHWMKTNHNMDWGATHVVDLIGRRLCGAHACYPDQSLPIGLVYKLPLFLFSVLYA